MWSSLRVGFFLALRQTSRSNIWTTGLIIFVMLLTFLNLVFVTGILIGLPIGASKAYKEQYSGDILISNFETKNFISRSSEVIKVIEDIPQIDKFSARYVAGGILEANYKTRTNPSDKIDQVNVSISGVDPITEDNLSKLSSFIIAGDYLNADDEGEILIGSNLLEKYNPGLGGDQVIANVDVGDRVRIKIGEVMKEVEVKGILKTKVGEINRRVFFTDRELRKLIGRTDFNVDEVAIHVENPIEVDRVKRIIQGTMVSEVAQIETSEESQGEFLKDIESTFALLGNIVGSISLVVASITIFIVIFINAFSRQKYIGILQGIGITRASILISYMLQGLFYALTGSFLGVIVLYTVLQPYFVENPLDFPFSDGILVAPIATTFFRIGLLILATAIAAYLPVRIIMRKKILDAILGR